MILETQSPSIKNIAKALATLQISLVAVKKDRKNPFFNAKYATLANVVEALRKPLFDAELSFTQVELPINNKSYLCTKLLHVSGEWVQGFHELIVVKPTPQALGSALTYARRYSLMGILGVVVDDDDDGNLANPKSGRKIVVDEL